MINVDDRLIREELPKIGVDAFAVLMCITSHINRQNKAWPGVDRLRQMAGLSKERTYKALAVLVESGHIERWQENDNGMFGRMVYRLTTEYLGIYLGVNKVALPESEPLAGKPEHGNPEHGKPYYGKPEHISINEVQPAINKPNKVNKGSTRSKFQKPEVEEIQTYLEELFLKQEWRPRFRENPQDMAGHFFDYYESNGWKVGRNSMKNWQAACRTWLNKNESYKPTHNGTAKQQPARPANGKLVSEETQRRVYAELLHEYGVTGGQG